MSTLRTNPFKSVNGFMFNRMALVVLLLATVLAGCQWTLNDTVVDTELQIIVPRSPGTGSSDGLLSASSVTPSTELFVHIIEADRFEQLYLESDELPPFPVNGNPPPEGARRLRPEQLGLSDSAVLRAFQDGTTLRGSRYFWLFGQGIDAEDGARAVTFRNLEPETDYIVYAIQGQRVFGEDENEASVSYFDYEGDIYWGAAAINLEPRSIVSEEINLSSALQFEPVILPSSYFEPLDSLGISLDRFPWEPPEVPVPFSDIDFSTVVYYEVTVNATISVQGYDDFSLNMHQIGGVYPSEGGYYFLDFYEDEDFNVANYSFLEIYDDPAGLEPSLGSYVIPENFDFAEEPGSLWFVYIQDDEQEIYIQIYPDLYDPEAEGESLEIESLDMGFQGGLTPSQGGTLAINFLGEAEVGPFGEGAPEAREVSISWNIQFGDPIFFEDNGEFGSPQQ